LSRTLNHVWFDGPSKSNARANVVRTAKSAIIVKKRRRTAAEIEEQTGGQNADYKAILPLFGFVAVRTSVCSAKRESVTPSLWGPIVETVIASTMAVVISQKYW
jgi:hypothetical protein